MLQILEKMLENGTNPEKGKPAGVPARWPREHRLVDAGFPRRQEAREGGPPRGREGGPSRGSRGTKLPFFPKTYVYWVPNLPA